MTRDEAQGFLDRGHADMDALGWWIAHEIGSELEWFRVTDADAAIFDALTGVPYGRAADKVGG